MSFFRKRTKTTYDYFEYTPEAAGGNSRRISESSNRPGADKTEAKPT
jgi:hypothetical protein